MATGTPPRWYRGATGHYSRSALPEIEQLGFGIAGYSLNADAGASLPAQSVAARITKATNGEIIVAHINQPNRPSGQGVVAGVRNLQHRGASFRRLDQLATTDIDYAATASQAATLDPRRADEVIDERDTHSSTPTRSSRENGEVYASGFLVTLNTWREPYLFTDDRL
jgi:hypothetical protein